MSFWKWTALLSTMLLLCSCSHTTPKKTQFHHITPQEFMKADIQAQQEQDNRMKRKSEELDKAHITGNQKAKQLEIEKVAAHRDFLRTLDENQKAFIKSMEHKRQQ